MKTAIINCDLDESPITNTAIIIKNILNKEEIIDYTKGETIKKVNEYNNYIITGSWANVIDKYYWINNLKILIKEINQNKIPCLGICFGMQIIADVFKGKISHGNKKEKGFLYIKIDQNKKIFCNIPNKFLVYESHTYNVTVPPLGSKVIGINDRCIQAFIYNNFYCVQFHPEIDYKIAEIMAADEDCDSSKILKNAEKDYNETFKILTNFINL